MTKKPGNILDQIGGTPLVSIDALNTNRDVEILAKLEYFNPGGSVKDRPALCMIEEAEKTGLLTKDKIILEATSGNTGIGLAMVAAVKGYRILLTMSEAVSEERVKILKALGADITFTPAHLGTDGAIEQVYNMIREDPDRYWLADQFNSKANWMAHYNGTAMEIWEQTGGRLDALVASMGTTGTLMGISRRFRELDPEIRIIGVEPYLGHKIQGLKNMKESYRPGIFEKERADRIINIDDEEAYHTARMLAKKEGLFVGMSSGAAMAVALKIAEEMDRGRIVVILPDGGERYLSTPLFTARKKSGLRLYNTLSRKKEEFVPIEEERVSIYSCGPTLCQVIDLAQCRRLLLADLIGRYLELKGYTVTHIMNVTDLDDRTIEGAEEAGVSLKKFTDRFYNDFMEDLDSLNILRAAEYPRPSEHVDQMIELTEKLLEKGYAYEKLRSIYFDISRFRDYGKLSGIDLDKIKLGKTVDLDQYEKENPRDFTLLKRSTLNELKNGIFFKTKWGNVRPGWHIECAAMALKTLGPTHDIHTSGVGLIFPHHENSIAISQAITGKPLANYWVHNEPVMTDVSGEQEYFESGQITLRELLKQGHTGREIRYWLLSRHYRKPIFFSLAKLRAAKNTISHLDKFVQRLHYARTGSVDTEMDQTIYALRSKFIASLDDDLNIAPALASLFQFARRINRKIDETGISTSDREKALKALERVNSVLGIMRLEPPAPDRVVEELVEKREDARKAGDWNTADDLRNRLLDMGVEVFDTRKGPVWRRVQD
ncbi:MAG: cysteine--tRNA ligase [Deltaproteobacteria bacterium]|nr:cysteine--tRNA ligase [Deltaproteobacteria bacterium]MBW2047928.1 cysteine--tRNA ligase [Deltaproteobacteria bacterium]MBW2112328.1 cysteine--tRNA ligase [Deltaproteobacteria bacterium]MBW2352974.1 cysteine--tRNA ligase [Deltaproteobacteria bacterium]